MSWDILWQEPKFYSCATKSDKIILHISTADEQNEEQLQEEDKEITNQENAGQCIAEETPNTARETLKSRQEPVKPLTLTTSRLHTLSTLRKTVGNLEAEFTQLKINIEGNFEQLKDKAVQQDHLLKLQKSHVGDLCDDLINSNKLLNDQL